MAIRNGEIQGNNAATQGGELPINPATGAPYFEVKAQGWGSGWRALNADELQALEQLKAGHVGEIRSLETLAESLPSLQGVNS